ncbi:MAG TPA: thioredoxin domain-containing protein [Devosiaceae bacterium]
MTLSRRQTLALLATLPIAGAAGLSVPALAKDGDLYPMLKLMAPAGIPDKIVLGPADAKVTVIEYASLTCPHCMRFNANTFPEVKSRYIDTGKIRYILRPYPRDNIDMLEWMLALTAQDSQHVVDVMFTIQDQLYATDKPGDLLKSTALQLGFTEETYQGVLTNQDMYNNLVKLRDQAGTEFGLEGTPTFYVNGKMLSGELSIDDLAKEIDPLL